MTRAFFEPLAAKDAWFLYAERPQTPLDIGTVYVFEGGSRVPGGRGAEGLEAAIAARLHLVPRYRQKIRRVAFYLGHPVWVDDPHFDLSYHVRHELLPPPADGAAMRRLVVRLLERPLDKRRPLWEMTVVHGLRGDRIVVVSRVHHAMVDGLGNLDIMTLLFDTTPEGSASAPAPPWDPRPAPSSWQLLRRELWNPLPSGAERPTPLRDRALSWLAAARGLPSLGRQLAIPRGRLFFNRAIGPRRTGRGLRLPLDQVKALKNRLGCTVNDAVLAIVAEGLHRWLAERGEKVPERVRVFIPVSVRQPGEKGGNRLSGMIVELPTGHLSLEERIRRVTVTLGDLKRSHQAVAAHKLAGLADWAPPSMLVLAGRLMSNPQAGANLNVTNVPGPQFPLYTGGARLLEVWPFAPLYPAMGLGVALVSYDGGLFFGLTADPAIVPDVEDFAGHLRAAAEASLQLV
ncbi:MAG TPA: wax ester/triacylglycerol synthase family O-acyltransferase [Candidatus Dormibacteraeota bacterium]